VLCPLAPQSPTERPCLWLLVLTQSIKLADGLKITHDWIKSRIEAEGGDSSAYATSTICGTAAPKELGTLRAADAEEKH
jgi:hypothetical protein